MSSPKSLIKRKAAKAVVLHTAHGAVSKARRRPARTASLLGIGMTLGAVVGFVLGRRQAATIPSPTGAHAFTQAPPTPFPAPTPTPTPAAGSPA